MKKALIYLIFFILSVIQVNAQLKASDKKILRSLVFEKINALRIKKNVETLLPDNDLVKAAILHSDYMSKNKKLTHIEYKDGFRKPSDRILYFNKFFVGFGENVLYTKPIKHRIDKDLLRSIANEIFNAWKNSKGHYANMISPDFTHGDLGFTYNKQSKRIYATHNFGTKGILIPNQLSNNAFGIKKKDKSCGKFANQYSSTITHLGNAVQIDLAGNIVLNYHNKERLFKSIIKDQFDGIAIDLVDRDQFSCGKRNELDASQIYNGVLLKPIYKKELLQNNLAEGDFRLIKILGKVPDNLRFKNLKPNLILLKNGRKCAYSTSSKIPSKRYNLVHVEPLIYTPNTPLKTEGINQVHKVYFNFDSNQVVASNSPKLPIDKNIYSIEIKSFTSVDGSSIQNKKLYQERAKFIKNYLGKSINFNPLNITIESKENWELFDYQLELSGNEHLLNREKNSKKEILRTNPIFWKEYLAKQRKSKAIIFQKGTWNENDEQHLYYNLTDALLTNNTDLVNKVLSEMYLQKNASYILNEEYMLEKFIKNKEFVQNAAALILKDIQFYDLGNVVFFVRNWLLKAEELSIEAQKNLLNLYTITTRKLLSNWDSKKEDLAKVLHPKKLKPLFEFYKSKDKVNPIFLNYHLSIIEYYGQINDGKEINKSFIFISDYFRKKSLAIEDDISLAHFFNGWSQYHLTVELLNKRYLLDDLNEDAFFILLKTKVVNYKKEQDEIDYMHEQALEMNKSRWCNWIESEFQLLQSKTVKKLYCKICTN